MGAKQDTGARGEDQAAQVLIDAGYRILDRNWRISDGEIDIVAEDRDGLIIFVEVKTRRNQAFGHPLEAITHAKAGRLRRLALAWLISHKLWSAQFRIDAIAIIGSGSSYSLDHRKAIL